MKNIFLSIFLSAFLMNAQEKNIDIAIAPYIDAQKSNLPIEAEQYMLNKLTSIVTQNGVSKGINSDIIITANTNVLNKEITPTAPAQYVLEIMVTLYIGNAMDGNLYNSAQITLNGVGQSETKAYINAIKNLNSNSKIIEKLIADSKSKIIKYYTEHCDMILAEASRLEKTDQYEAALYKLMSIPQACTTCYLKANSKSEAIYKKYIDFDCKIKLNQAKQIWNASPNENGAMDATTILMQINPNATCFNEIKSFGNEISKKMNENDKREWNVYYEKEVGLQKDYIQAIKEIGKAYGEGQPKQIYNNIKWW